MVHRFGGISYVGKLANMVETIKPVKNVLFEWKI
jgi:hypothetical protein